MRWDNLSSAIRYRCEVLGAILERYTVLDMSVQDPPLDQVIAKVFEEGSKKMAPV